MTFVKSNTGVVMRLSELCLKKYNTLLVRYVSEFRLIDLMQLRVNDLVAI